MTISNARIVLGMKRAQVEAGKADCPRAGVGVAILSDNGFVIGTGYNKRAVAFGKCNCDSGPSTKEGKSSTCQAVHAEVYAINDVANRFKKYMTVLVSTRPPCYQCLNFLATTDIKTIVVSGEWDDRDGSKQRWIDIDREWIVLH